MRSFRLSKLVSASLVAAGMLVGASTASFAASVWPARTIKFIVPFPAGGATDTIARVYADKLSEALKQPVVVDNKPGAGTGIAAEYVATAEPDGYTIALAPAAQLAILPHINANIRFDPFKSFAPVSLLASVPYVVAASPNTPINNVKELIAAAKKDPGKLTYSSCGPGTMCHLSGEMFKSQTGTDLLHVPFKGSAPAINALIGDQVNLAFDTLTVLAPQIRDGKVKGLVIGSRERSPLLPNVPTATEAGLPDYAVESWFGLVVPAATPADIVQRLNAEVVRIGNLPDVRERLAAQGLTVTTNSPEEYAQLIRADYARWGRVVDASGAQIN